MKIGSLACSNIGMRATFFLLGGEGGILVTCYFFIWILFLVDKKTMVFLVNSLPFSKKKIKNYQYQYESNLFGY